MTTNHETVGDVLAEMRASKLNLSGTYWADRIERAHAADAAMRKAVRKMAQALASDEWAEHALDSDDDVSRLEAQITRLVGAHAAGAGRVPAEMQALYDAASKGFHTTALSSGRDSRYEYVSSFRNIDDMHAYGLAFCNAMKAPSAAPDPKPAPEADAEAQREEMVALLPFLPAIPRRILDAAEMVEDYMRLNHPGPWSLLGIQSVRDAHTSPEPRAAAAVRSLEALGYTYHGGSMWKPPLGKPPSYVAEPAPQPAPSDALADAHRRLCEYGREMIASDIRAEAPSDEDLRAQLADIQRTLEARGIVSVRPHIERGASLSNALRDTVEFLTAYLDGRHEPAAPIGDSNRVPAPSDAPATTCWQHRPGSPCPVPASCRSNGCSAVEREMFPDAPASPQAAQGETAAAVRGLRSHIVTIQAHWLQTIKVAATLLEQSASIMDQREGAALRKLLASAKPAGDVDQSPALVDSVALAIFRGVNGATANPTWAAMQKYVDVAKKVIPVVTGSAAVKESTSDALLAEARALAERHPSKDARAFAESVAEYLTHLTGGSHE